MAAIRVFIDIGFMVDNSNLPKEVQGKVNTFFKKFSFNPHSPALNLEKINGAPDDHLRSARLDRNYRVLAAFLNDNLYGLLKVGKHEEIYRWAGRNRIGINPSNGGMEIVDIPVVHKQEEPEMITAPAAVPGLLDSWTDAQLARIGIAEEWFPAIRNIKTEEELEKSEELFPKLVHDAVYMLACGTPLEEVVSDYHDLLTTKPELNVPIDLEDFDKAIDNPAAKSRFKILGEGFNFDDLPADMPVEDWRVFLHPSQSALIKKDANGPVRVLGSAGTGKTVVAIHRAKWLAENVYTEHNDKILVTTFTKNLAEDINSYISYICNPETIKRIQTVNLDQWAYQYLKGKGYEFNFPTGEQLNEIWNKAYKPDDGSFDHQFYKEEWEQVVQANRVHTVEEYVKVSRTGRGRRVSRQDRVKIWEVFEEFRSLMNQGNLKDRNDIFWSAAQFLEKETAQIYRAVIVDEGQDLSAAALTMIRKIVPPGKNDLMIVGDTHQRIYGGKISLSKCGIDIRGRGKKLKINYRTTREINQYAASVLSGISFDDMDGGNDPLFNSKSLTSGDKPKTELLGSFDEEFEAIVQRIREFENEGIDLRTVCITCREQSLMEKYQEKLGQWNIPFIIVNKNKSHKSNVPGVRLATMHRIKGIEFDYLVLASVSKEYLPLQRVLNRISDPVEKEQFEVKERSLLYVALTRARKGVFIYGYGERSPLLPAEC